MEWCIVEHGYRAEKIPMLGNRFLLGNGYMGIRGTLEEYKKDKLVAINLAGIFDQVGNGWREPLNAPNGLFTLLTVDGETLCLPEREASSHVVALDFRKGLFARETIWNTAKGTITVRSERFVHREHLHLCGMRYEVSFDFEGNVEILTGIDGDVWDIHGPHYDSLETESDKGTIWMKGITHEKKETVTTMETISVDFAAQTEEVSKDKFFGRKISFRSNPGKVYAVEKMFAVFTSQDVLWSDEKAAKLLHTASKEGYAAYRTSHVEYWEKLWRNSEVLIEGDEEAYKALNYSIYHLLSIAPPAGGSISIPARGLSGQTYKGAIFWDTEMFMLDFFLFTNPETAKSLVKYRIDTLAGARKKAQDYGFDGAFYAWESQEGGYDACTDYNVTDVFTGRPVRTYFRDKQVHISAAVAYGILRYVDFTGDTSVLTEGGMETIVECAKFYYSLLLKRVGKDYYEIHDVIGPDEYHERVNNNGYTNRMAKYVMEQAALALEQHGKEARELTLEADELIAKFRDGASKLILPQPNEDGVLEQFDGYFKLEDATLEQVRGRLLHEKEYWGGGHGVASDTQVIKQADVVTWLAMFSEDHPEDIQLKNWEYYEPRTEHGSSLSSCMYGLLACRCKMANRAYPFFLKSAKADLTDGGKEWAGLVYIGGTHPAAAGGAFMNAVEGFAGLRFENNTPSAFPCLPDGWNKVAFKVCYRGEHYQIVAEPNNCTVEKI